MRARAPASTAFSTTNLSAFSTTNYCCVPTAACLLLRAYCCVPTAACLLVPWPMHVRTHRLPRAPCTATPGAALLLVCYSTMPLSLPHGWHAWPLWAEHTRSPSCEGRAAAEAAARTPPPPCPRA